MDRSGNKGRGQPIQKNAENEIANRFSELMKKKPESVKETEHAIKSVDDALRTMIPDSWKEDPIPTELSTDGLDFNFSAEPVPQTKTNPLPFDLDALSNVIAVLDGTLPTMMDEQTRAAKLKEMAGLAARVTSLLQFSKFDAREFIVAVKEFKSRAEDYCGEVVDAALAKVSSDAVALVKSVTPKLKTMKSDDFMIETQSIVMSLTQALEVINANI